MEQAKYLWINKNKLCWIQQESEQLFVPGTVKLLNLKKGSALVETDRGAMQLQLRLLFERTSPQPGVKDLSALQVLNPSEILQILRTRFGADKIYTMVGPTLVAINPYRSLDSLYAQPLLAHYRQLLQSSAKNYPFAENQPHIFSLAALMRKRLAVEGRSQALVISGESGSGKTQTTKKALFFLASLQSAGPASLIEERIIASNPILEAFGNAKTLRNDNSSRFGKYLRVLYSPKGQISGASFEKYLLQKSRVTSVSPGQRNFHIFYYCAATNHRKQKFALLAGEQEGFEQSATAQFGRVIQSFRKFGLDDGEITSVTRVISAILYLSNVNFDQSTFSDTRPCQVLNKADILEATALLGVRPEQFQKSLVFKTRVVGKSQINSPQGKDACLSSRNALSRGLYSKLFDWIVQRINRSLKPDAKPSGHIGLLDIFGFESFDTNSLEQLCINFANQKLHQLFIDLLFKAQIEEYRRAGLQDLSAIKFQDNQPVIDSIQAPPKGVFTLLSDSCKLGADNDQLFLLKIVKSHEKNPRLRAAKERGQFVVSHSQKQVFYNVAGFRTKNMDGLSPDIISLMSQSKDRVISHMWSEVVQPEKSLVTKFNSQIKVLLQQLRDSQTNFAKCIKPNLLKQPRTFSGKVVLDQVCSLGILECVEIRKLGYPVRMDYKQFASLYRPILKGKPPSNQIDLVRGIADQAALKNIVFTKQKIFMKSQEHAKLQSLLFQAQKLKYKNFIKVLRQFRVYKFKKVTKRGLARLTGRIRAFKLLCSTTPKMTLRRKYEAIRRIKQFSIARLQKRKQELQARSRDELRKKEEIRSKEEQKAKQAKQIAKPQTAKAKQPSVKQYTKVQTYQSSRGQPSRPEGMMKKLDLSSKGDNLDDRPPTTSRRIVRQKQCEAVLTSRGVQNELNRAKPDQIWPDIWNYQYECSRDINPSLMKEGGKAASYIQPYEKAEFLPLEGYDEEYLMRVRSRGYFQYFLEYINSRDLRELKTKEELIQAAENKLTHQKADLKGSLLNLNGMFVREAEQAYSCLLKICKLKRSSRQPQQNLVCLLNMGNGMGVDSETRRPVNLVEKAMLLKQYRSKLGELKQEANYSTIGFYKSTKTFESSRILNSPDNSLTTADSSVGINTRFANVLGNPIFVLRDQIYFQLIKLTRGCKKIQVLKEVLSVFLAVVRSFPPSMRAVYPVANFVLKQLDSGTTFKSHLLTMFQLLSQYVQSYQFLHMQNFQTIFSRKRSQEQLRELLPSQLYVFAKTFKFRSLPYIAYSENAKDYLQRLQTRVIYETVDAFRITRVFNFAVSVNLFTGGVVKVNIKPYQSLRDLRNTICELLGLERRTAFFSLFQQEEVFGEITKQKILRNDIKVWDVLMQQERQAKQQQAKFKRSVKFYLFLGLRIFYNFDQSDRNATRLYFAQAKKDFAKAHFPLNQTNLPPLLATLFFKIHGPPNPQTLQNFQHDYEDVIPPLLRHLKSKALGEAALEEYRKLQFTESKQVQQYFLKQLRQFALFPSHQFECQFFVMRGFDEGSRKEAQEKGRLVVLGVRPGHLAVCKQNRQLLELIQYDKITSFGMEKNQFFIFRRAGEVEESLIFVGEEALTIKNLVIAYSNLKLGDYLEDNSSLPFEGQLS